MDTDRADPGKHTEASPTAEPLIQASATEERLRRLERRDWWLWSIAILVMLLLAVVVYSFTLTPPGGVPDRWWEEQRIAMRSLRTWPPLAGRATRA